VALAWAPNARAALALARAGVEDGVSAPLERVLDALPMATLSAVRPHLPTLARIGCRRLGDLRRLPRAGLARRFDAALLAALDQAYGRARDACLGRAAAVFDARLELPHRVDDAQALVFGARRLLLQLAAWLSARHSGVTAFTLHWAHDAMRSRGVGEGGQLTVRTAEPTREVGTSRGCWPSTCRTCAGGPGGRPAADGRGRGAAGAAERRHGCPTTSVIGSRWPRCWSGWRRGWVRSRVVRPLLCEDHRPEAMGRWQPASQVLPRGAAGGARRAAADLAAGPAAEAAGAPAPAALPGRVAAAAGPAARGGRLVGPR
jgi:protein ImuB